MEVVIKKKKEKSRVIFKINSYPGVRELGIYIDWYISE